MPRRFSPTNNLGVRPSSALLAGSAATAANKAYAAGRQSPSGSGPLSSSYAANAANGSVRGSQDLRPSSAGAQIEEHTSELQSP